MIWKLIHWRGGGITFFLLNWSLWVTFVILWWHWMLNSCCWHSNTDQGCEVGEKNSKMRSKEEDEKKKGKVFVKGRLERIVRRHQHITLCTVCTHQKPPWMVSAYSKTDAEWRRRPNHGRPRRIHQEDKMVFILFFLFFTTDTTLDPAKSNTLS